MTKWQYNLIEECRERERLGTMKRVTLESIMSRIPKGSTESLMPGHHKSMSLLKQTKTQEEQLNE